MRYKSAFLASILPSSANNTSYNLIAPSNAVPSAVDVDITPGDEGVEDIVDNQEIDSSDTISLEEIKTALYPPMGWFRLFELVYPICIIILL